MKNPFKTYQLKSAASRRNHFDLSSNHLTTADFSQITPCYYRDLVPNDSFKIKTKVSCYTAPLVVPPIANAHIKTRCFFVPYRIVMKYFNDWITHTQINNGDGVLNATLPEFSSFNVIQMFLQHMTAFETSPAEGALCTETQNNQGAVETDSDVVVYYDGSPFKSFDFTPLGRRVYKIFRSLGYTWNWIMDAPITFNALPLMCFFKAYLDYYEPLQTYVASPINTFLQNWYDYVGSSYISDSELYDCLTHCLLTYENDYFTSAWQYPNKVANADHLNSNVSFGRDFVNLSDTSERGKNDIVRNGHYGTDLIKDGATSTNYYISRISQYGLDLLNSVDQWLKRNNYAGAAKAAETILARFGVRVPDDKLDKTEFIGFDDTPIVWQQVTNTTASTNPNIALGSFGAKGMAIGEPKTFSYEAKEHGFLLMLSCIVPDSLYYHGVDRQNLQTDPLDFFQPEFETLGTSPIRSIELFADATFSSLGSYYPTTPLAVTAANAGVDDVFGFAPNYANYKVKHDLITGDFNVPTLADPLSSWHFGREIQFRSRAADQGEAITALTPLNILYYKDYVSQYNRIFNVQDNTADHFIEIFSFQVDAFRPMLSLSDSIPLDGRGEDVTLQPNGARMS